VTRTGITIAVNSRVDLDFALEVGTVQQNVQVTGAAPLLQTDTSALSTNFSPKLMDDAPLFLSGGERNPEAFASYLPGVTSTGASQGYNQSTEVSDNGGDIRTKEVLLDGTTMQMLSAGTVLYFLSAEEVGEFSLVTNGYSAEYGMTGGGVEVFTTKSGTNGLHGDGFEFLQNDVLNARGWAVNSVPGARKAVVEQNEYGGSIGGPVIIPKVYDGRNRLFWEFTYDGYRQNHASSYANTTIPTTAMLQGNFSSVVNSSGVMVPIYDPATTTTAAGVTTRTAFPGNIIPTNRFSAVSKNMLPLIPAPTSSALTNNYLGNSQTDVDRYTWSTKIDWSFTPRNKVSAFSSRDTSNTQTFGPLPGPLSAGWVDYDLRDDYRLNYNASIHPNLLNSAAFGISIWHQFYKNPQQSTQNWAQTLPLSGTEFGFPIVIFGSNGFASWAATNGGKTIGGYDMHTKDFRDSLSWIKGKHMMSFGFQIMRAWETYVPLNYSYSQGEFTFQNFETASPAAKSTTGNSFASFLLGAVDNAYGHYTALNYDALFGLQAWYVQDNIKMTPKLTLNLGLRYEIYLPRSDGHSEMSGFDPTQPNSAAGNLLGVLAYAGFGAGHTGKKRFSDIDYRDLGPRLGFAYALNPKTVVRGGFGIAYSWGNADSNGFCDTNCNLGFDSYPQWVSDGLDPAANWDGGFVAPPGVTWLLPPIVSPTFANGQSPNYFSPKSGQPPRILNYSLNVQRELPAKLFLSVAYAGSRGQRLTLSPDINQVNSKYLSLGTLLGQSITSAPVVAAGYTPPYAGFTGTLAQALRPYPQFSSILNAFSTYGESTYNSLQTTVERRFGDFTMMAAYTFSKTMSNGSWRQGLGENGTGPGSYAGQDAYNLSTWWSLSPYDRPSVFNLIYRWELPFGTSKKYLNSVNPVARQLVSGWKFSALQQYESGTLLLITVPNSLGSGVLYSDNTFPNITGQPFRTETLRDDLDPNNPNLRWINSKAYAQPAAYTFGNAARFYGSVRNPMNLSENFSLAKRTQIKESVALEYRVETANPFNRTEFGAIQTDTTSANFGRPTNAMYTPRTIQMSLKVLF
jgi:hypothetical protein